ncbi:MAG: hypothetical protein HYR74_12450 [Candidatus Eisenbacteria bacterium]|nr:hypothetical protein [Candidatus Eisenbacteria bacterium]
MKRIALPLAAAAALTLMVTPAARAGVPSVANSTVDPCLRVCPAGDMTFHVVVRDGTFNPVPGSSVAIDLCACPGVVLCPLNGSENYIVSSGCMVVQITNAAGVADYQIRAGGTCSGGPIPVYADGQLLATRTAVSSPDQNGDVIVNATDQAILAGKMSGPYDPTGDFNCSGSVEPGDANILASHLGHSCAVAVPTRPATWGRIKTIYR